MHEHAKNLKVQLVRKRAVKIIVLCLPLVALFCSACEEAPFAVKNIIPGDGAENMPRTTAVTLSVTATSDIRADLLNTDYFILEDMGKDFKPTAEPAKKSGEIAPPQGIKTSTSSKTEEKKDAASTSGKKVAAKVYVYAAAPVVSQDGPRYQYEVAISPLTLLQAQHTYRITISKDVSDNDQHMLLTNKISYFKVGNSPSSDGKAARLIYSAPIDFASRPPAKKVDESDEDYDADAAQDAAEDTKAPPSKAADTESTTSAAPAVADPAAAGPAAATSDTPSSASTTPSDANPATQLHVDTLYSNNPSATTALQGEEKKDGETDKLRADAQGIKSRNAELIPVNPEQRFLFRFDQPMIPSEFEKRVLIRYRDIDSSVTEKMEIQISMVENPLAYNKRFQTYLVITRQALTGKFSIDVNRKSKYFVADEDTEKREITIDKDEFVVDLDDVLHVQREAE